MTPGDWMLIFILLVMSAILGGLAWESWKEMRESKRVRDFWDYCYKRKEPF